MKRFAKSVLGVTLLEIMLVLAIAAMVIVMSVRYYQSANVNQQANAFISQLQAMQAAADSLAQATGSYSNTATASNVASVVGGANAGSSLQTTWGGTVTAEPQSATVMQYDTTLIPTAVCTLTTARLGADPHWINISSDCETIQYTSVPPPSS